MYIGSLFPIQEVGLLEKCIPFIEKCSKSKNSFNVRFVTKEPNSLFVGVKMGVTSTGSADGSVNAAHNVFIYSHYSLVVLTLEHIRKR